MKPRISMITLGVHDIARSIKFYEHGLRFPRIESPPEVAFFNLNGSWLGLFHNKALADDACVEFSDSTFHHSALAHLLTSKDEVDEAFAAAIQAGATSCKPPQDVFWGGYAGYFADPDNHLWELAYNPFLWIGPVDTADNTSSNISVQNSPSQ